MTRPIKIVIADDHEIFREGFRLLLKNQREQELVGEAANGRELLEVVGREFPDVVITDIKMPVMDGIEACKLIIKKFPGIKVIALSMFNEESLVLDMLEAGAKGYLLKNTNKQELLSAVKTVVNGDNYYCSDTSLKLAKLIAASKYHPHRPVVPKKFTEREMQIIRMICDQMSSKEIAHTLSLSIRTVEGYREQVQEKVGAKNSIGIVIYAIRNKLVEV